MRGRLYCGTSGFAYPGWMPRFYASGSRPRDLLPQYAARLTAVELNNTFYRQPSAEKVAAWLAATPDAFRFVVKAQRGGSFRSFADPEPGLPWLTGPYRAFGSRLGAVLFRLPDGARRDDARLERFLAAWPADLPLVVELRDDTWHVDETYRALEAAGASLCATELPEDPAPPTLRRTASRLYLRLRRHDYDTDALRDWLARISPFLDAGDDAYVFFRHDEVGRGAELAVALLALADGAAAAGTERGGPLLPSS